MPFNSCLVCGCAYVVRDASITIQHARARSRSVQILQFAVGLADDDGYRIFVNTLRAVCLPQQGRKELQCLRISSRCLVGLQGNRNVDLAHFLRDAAFTYYDTFQKRLSKPAKEIERAMWSSARISRPSLLKPAVARRLGVTHLVAFVLSVSHGVRLAESPPP